MTFFTKKFRGPDVRMHIRPPNYGVGKPPSVIATYLRFGIIAAQGEVRSRFLGKYYLKITTPIQHNLWYNSKYKLILPYTEKQQLQHTMINNPKFTIILSGHQTAPYLPKALNSIVAQTFKNFETICYVEESTDDSLAICQDMARRDPRFKVATGPKSGAVATTRNYGIDHAAGEYLVVVDGDDWIVPDMLEKLAAKLAQTGPVDVLAFAAISTTSDNVDFKTAPLLTNFRLSDAHDVFSGLDAIRRAGRNGGQMRNFTPLNAYRTEFLRKNRIRQTDGLLMEDLESTPRIWYFAERFAYIDEPFYVYRRRPNSLTTEASPRIAIDVARQFRSLVDFADAHDIPNDIMRIWVNQWLSVVYWYLFHPVTSRKVSADDRARALSVLFDGDGRALFKKTASFASIPKRVAARLVSLAEHGWQEPARLFFRKLYYPLVERRGQHRQ